MLLLRETAAHGTKVGSTTLVQSATMVMSLPTSSGSHLLHGVWTVLFGNFFPSSHLDFLHAVLLKAFSPKVSLEMTHELWNVSFSHAGRPFISSLKKPQRIPSWNHNDLYVSRCGPLFPLLLVPQQTLGVSQNCHPHGISDWPSSLWLLH